MSVIETCEFITLKIKSSTIKICYLIDNKNNKIELNIYAAYIVNNSYITRKMCIEGFGIAEKSYWDIKDDIASGKLIQILPKYKVLFDPKDKPTNRISLIYQSRNYQPYRVRMISDFITNNFSRLEK